MAMLLLFNLINKENTKMSFISDLFSGFATGGQQSAKSSSSPYNSMYNTANNNVSYTPTPTSNYNGITIDDVNPGSFLYYDTVNGGVQQVSATPQVQGATTSTSTVTRPAPVDPYAKYGGRAAYDAQVGEFNQNKDSILDSANMSRRALFNQGRSSILDFIDDAKLTQQGIDQKRANAQFSLQEGKSDIMDMVGRGIRSGGVMLANKNAASSGAAGQIARAYGELGNREARDVGNQFELENQGINVEQQGLATNFEKQRRKIDEFKVNQTDSIVNSAKADLQALEARRIGASLPELFQIDQLTQQIKDATMAKLGELDGLLQTERAKINPMSKQQVLAKANQMRTAGTGGPQMFDFNTNAANMQTTGAPIAGAELPIYSNLALNRRREV